MRVSEHLAKFHTMAAAHHRGMAKLYGDAMGKAVAGDPVQTFLKSAKGMHEQAADGHDEMCQACEKATADSLNKIVPTHVSAVASTDPGLTAVPRAGQRPVSAKVESEFSKLLGLNPEDMHVEERSLNR